MWGDFMNYYVSLFNRLKRRKSKVITTIALLKRLHKKLMSVEEFAFDTETNTLKVNGPNENLIVVGISISWGFYDNYL